MRSLGLFAVLLAACATDPMMDDQEAGGGGKADGTGSGTLAARYGLELTSITKLEDTRDSSVSTYTLRARALVTTTQTTDSVKLAVKLCDVTLPQVSGYQPQLAPAFVASLAKLDLTGHITDGTLETDPAALVLGAALHAPLTDALPTDGSDSRVRDQDNDGNPGVSIKIPGYGNIFSALRVKLSITAPIDNVDKIAGDADVHLDEAIYGDDIWFYDAASSLAESQMYTQVVSAQNEFKMASGITTCPGVDAKYP